MPALEHLELFTGADDYGADSTIEHVERCFDPAAFPSLKYLGIKNSMYQDEIAKRAVASDILPQLEVLDLSLGTLSDVGAEALLQAKDRLQHLKLLILQYHYISDELTKQLTMLPLEVDVSDKETDDEYDGEVYRYVAVGE